MARIPTYKIFTNDTLPILKFTIQKSDGTGPQNLTSVAAKCFLRLQGQSNNLLTGTQTNCNITDAANGKLQYILPTPITDPGIYTGQILLDFGGGQLQRSERFIAEVEEGIANQ